MRTIPFTEDDLRAIAHERYYHPDPHVQRKMEVLWLKHHGQTHERIATLAGVSRSSVQRYLSEFLRGGLEEVRRCPWAGPTSALEEHRVSLDDHFRQHPPRSVREAQEAIRQRTGILRGLTQVRRFLRRLGLEPRKVAAVPVPPKKAPEEHAREQRQFLDEKLGPVLSEARAGRRDVYFVDASHFVYAAFLGWLWCAARFFVRAASGRKRYNVLGALHAVSHRLIRVTNHSYINAESICALLRAVAQAGVGRPITLVLDNARYQKCALVQELARSLRIGLLYLPSYSPNLNLIERVWRFVKKQCLRAAYHDTYEAFTAAIDKCLGELDTTHKKDMDSLLTHEFQMFDAVPLLAA
jgi:transposase